MLKVDSEPSLIHRIVACTLRRSSVSGKICGRTCDMTELVSSVADKIDRAVQRVTPLAYRVRRTGRRWVRRALRKPRSVSEGQICCRLLIQVLASFTKGGWRSTRGRDRLEPWFSALRLSGGGLLGAATVVPAGALRAAGSRRHGAETRRATEHGAQDHAGRSALRPDLASRIETGAGRRVLFVHVTTRHGRASHRHRLPTQCLGGFRSVDLPARRVARSSRSLSARMGRRM